MTPPLARREVEDTTSFQRQAGLTLIEVLGKHKTLRRLRWSVAPHGCGLIGEVVAIDAETIQLVFAEWQHALDLSLMPSRVRGQLVAAGELLGCRITITATIKRGPIHERD